jgi:hypothetical protein
MIEKYNLFTLNLFFRTENTVIIFNYIIFFYPTALSFLVECIGFARGMARRKRALENFRLTLHPSNPPIAGLSASAIALGAFYTCALMSDGGVMCWGRNDYGQLGIGSYEDRTSPVRVPGATGLIRVMGIKRRA